MATPPLSAEHAATAAASATPQAAVQNGFLKLKACSCLFARNSLAAAVFVSGTIVVSLKCEVMICSIFLRSSALMPSHSPLFNFTSILLSLGWFLKHNNLEEKDRRVQVQGNRI